MNVEREHLVENGLYLPVMEHFLTIQGEGYHSGRAAYFVRLGGCDVGCVWCDVKESWDATAHEVMSVNEILSIIKGSGADFVVITGGEPFMYDLGPLTALLNDNELEVAVETAGVYPITGEFDWICFSPKKFKKPIEEYYARADELKVVVFNKHDLEWAEEHAARISEGCLQYLQPEWDKRNEMLPLVIDHVKKHPTWRISLQTHKYINVP